MKLRSVPSDGIDSIHDLNIWDDDGQCGRMGQPVLSLTCVHRIAGEILFKRSSSPQMLRISLCSGLSGLRKHCIDALFLQRFLSLSTSGDEKRERRKTHRQAGPILFEKALAFICSRVPSQIF